MGGPARTSGECVTDNPAGRVLDVTARPNYTLLYGERATALFLSSHYASKQLEKNI